MEPVKTQNHLATEKLRQERQDTEDRIANLREDLLRLGEPSADENDIDAYEREKIFALIQSLERKIDSLERAIQFAEKGVYGLCENCGDRIDPARLEILPHATLCLKCQREYERRHRRS